MLSLTLCPLKAFDILKSGSPHFFVKFNITKEIDFFKSVTIEYGLLNVF